MRHTSDCAIHNAPAEAAGVCDCGATPEPWRAEMERARKISVHLYGYGDEADIERIARALAERAADEREKAVKIAEAAAEPNLTPEMIWLVLGIRTPGLNGVLVDVVRTTKGNIAAAIRRGDGG